MSLEELYQELIIDHGTAPRNCRKLDKPCTTSEGYNPLCGDHILLYLKIENNIIIEATFQGTGCAISTASASLMTEALLNKSLTEVQALFQQFQLLVTSEDHQLKTLDPKNVDAKGTVDLGKLAALSGVKAFPVRVKCATLPWHTLNAALKKEMTPV